MKDEIIGRAFITAVVAGVYGTLVALLLLGWQGKGDGDFTWPLEAARWLARGENPYARIVDRGYFPYDSPFYYPIMAALVAMPFTRLPVYLAGAAFFGMGSGLMGYAVARNRMQAWPVFVSVPYFMAASVAQWAPWLFAAALLPGLQCLLTCKPTLGLAAFLREPSWSGVRSMAWAVLIGLAAMPGWPGEWLRTAGSSTRHVAPVVLLPLGPLLVLFALWWRRRGGRLGLALALVPQFIWFYDQALLWLVPRSWQAGVVLAAASWVGYALTRMDLLGMREAVVGLVYLPALACVAAEYFFCGED